MAVTLSPKYQIVIPEPIRKEFRFKPGMKFEFIPYQGHILISPLRPLTSLFGAFPDIDAKNIREKKDRPL